MKLEDISQRFRRLVDVRQFGFIEVIPRLFKRQSPVVIETKETHSNVYMIQLCKMVQRLQIMF